MTPRQYLQCSFEQKDEVRRLGAHWDPIAKKWYVPAWANAARFAAFLNPLAEPALADEGQMTGQLYIDLVPSTCWYSNVRSMVSPSLWNDIRRIVYAQSNARCEICKGRGPAHPVEAHERWAFNMSSKMQTLQRIEALCPACHEATHYGFAQTQGRGPTAKKRFEHVNGWSSAQIEEHIMAAFAAWRLRNTIKDWTLDLSWLDTCVVLDDSTKNMLNAVKEGRAPRK